MDPVCIAIATVGVDRAKAAFPDRPCDGALVRFTGFRRAEVSAMVKLLHGWAPWPGRPVQLVVTAREPWEGLPPEVFLDPDTTPTKYRNGPVPVVYFETDAYSDRQGLGKVYRITDRDLLAGGQQSHTRQLLTRTLWSHHHGADVPGVLNDALDDVWNSLGTARDHGVDLRSWTAFVGGVTRRRSDQELVTLASAWTRIGEALPLLGLLTDDVLGTDSISRTEQPRRIKRNARMMRGIRTGEERWLDELREKLENTEFEEPDGSPTPPSVRASVRTGLQRLLGSDPEQSNTRVPFRYLEQVVSKQTKRRGIGDALRAEVETVAPDRVEELDELDVIDRLNREDQDAAIKFLDESPEGGGGSLLHLVSPSLRKTLLKLADPTQRVARQPLRTLLRSVHEAILERGEEARGTLRLGRMRRRGDVDDELTTAAFAWLYGPILRRIQEQVRDDETRFEIDDELVDSRSFEKKWRRQLDSTTDQNAEPLWETLRLQLSWKEGGTVVQFEWRPREVAGQVMLCRVVRSDAHHWLGAQGQDFDTWLRSALEGGPLATPGKSDHFAQLPQGGMSLRSEIMGRLAEEGLDPETLLDYETRWLSVIEAIRTDHRPDGNPEPMVDAFLCADTWRGADGTIAMLANHPLRLRWLRHDFNRTASRIVDALRGRLDLNGVNDGVFFEHIERASPRAHPPAIVVEGRQYVAVRELDWHETFQLVRDKTGLRAEWLAELDDEVVDAAAQMLVRYVEAYPHKADGLHLLTLVRPGGAGAVVRTLGALRTALELLGGSRIDLALSVFAPQSEFVQLETDLQRFDDDDRHAKAEFPSIRVIWHRWSPTEQPVPDLTAVEEDVDIALIPNLFGTQAEARESTEARVHEGSPFEPWLDATTTIVGGHRDGQPTPSVSRKLLPERHDPLLEAWSTVCVRQFRSSSVSGDSPDDAVDYFEFRVPFANSAAFFADLHARAHWVLTLDPFVGREQIEALPSAPDVITVKAQLGSTGSHGLVVSSRAGRQFIEHRLERRLRTQLPSGLANRAPEFAKRTYDHARMLVPGILLRALGLGRTAQEMVGLVVTRRRVSEDLPVDLGESGFEAWLSLDEHTDWFGGPHELRADLARVSGSWTQGRLSLRVLVVESKFRENIDVARADEQLRRSVSLFSDALATGNHGHPDGEVWRRLLVDAMRRLTKGGAHRFSPQALRAQWMNRPFVELPPQIRDAILQGDYDLATIEGLLCTLPAPDVDSEKSQTPRGHQWLRMSVREIAALLDRLDEAPQAEDQPASATQPIPPATESDRPAGVSSDVPGFPPPSDRLRARHQKVIDVLAAHGVAASPDGDEPMVEGPSFYLCRVGLPRGVTPKAVHKLAEELQYGLGLPAGLLPRSYTDRGAVVVEVPKEDYERHPVWAQDLWARTHWPQDRLYAPIGVDVRYQEVGVDFSSSKSPHLLVGGMTGGGKSVALETILRGLMQSKGPEHLRLFIIDPKGTEFTAFEEMPHVVKPIGMDAEDAIATLEQCVEEMQARYKRMKERRVRDLSAFNELVGAGERMPWHVVVLDEYADLTSDKDSKKSIEGLVQRLAQKARACGIHIIVATQKPTADVISSTTRSNLGAQLALRVKNSIDSRVIMDDVGAESLAGNGDSFLRLSGTEPRRIQCAIFRVRPAL
jgi:S-DNA-T family DNA segregation ATPase FtsK/SpoIIIE